MMQTHLTLTIALTLFTCSVLHASDKCGVIEYPDHIEVRCTGTPVPASPATPASPVTATTAAAVPKNLSDALHAAPPGDNETAEPSAATPQPKPASDHRPHRMAADTIEAARTERLQNIMSIKP
jgi:hypothetical protein